MVQRAGDDASVGVDAQAVRQVGRRVGQRQPEWAGEAAGQVERNGLAVVDRDIGDRRN